MTCLSVCVGVRLLSFEVSLVTLDGLFDAQQQRGVPLVQTRDGVKLLDLNHKNHGTIVKQEADGHNEEKQVTKGESVDLPRTNWPISV